jgi:hypothetical protein
MKLIKWVTMIVFTGMMFSCVVAVMKMPAPQSAGYHSGVSCSMVESRDGRGTTTTLDCNWWA